MFGAVLLYAGLGEAESVSLSKLEDGCCAGAESGGGQNWAWFAAGLDKEKRADYDAIDCARLCLTWVTSLL